MSAPVAVVHPRERLTNVVQAVGRRPADVERRPRETLAIFFLFLAAYSVVGYWLVVQKQVVGFETLDRLDRALMIWHNDPTKLSAIGFDYPPLATLLVSPLAWSSTLVSSLVVVPLASAVFAAGTMTSLNTMMRRAQLDGALRALLLLGVGANPLVVLYAASGARQFVWISFVVMALGALFAWYVTADIRFIMAAGLAFSVASLAGYSSLLWFVLSAVMIGAVLAKLGAGGDEVEGTTVGFATPAVYVMALWTAMNAVILHRPLDWITSSAGKSNDFTALELVRSTGRLVLDGAPIAILVLPGLIYIGISQKNTFALWLGILLGAAILSPAAAVLLHLSDAPMHMRNALPILLLAVIGGLWLARSAGDGGRILAGALGLGLLVSVPWTFHTMSTYPQQGLESSFAAAVSTGNSQAGAVTLNGERVGYADELSMADWITSHIDERNRVLTDNAETYAVILLTGRPDLFVDRVDKSDGPWLEISKDPAGTVDFLLMTKGSTRDMLTKQYPDAAAGTDPRLPVVFETDRYVVVAVPPTFDPATQVTTTGTTTSSATPTSPEATS